MGIENTLIYCITTAEKWSQSKQKGVHTELSLEAEGFIHCSYPHQLLRVANKYFKDVEGPLILCIDRSQLESEVVDEDLSDLGELYPHIYGGLMLMRWLRCLRFKPQSKGSLVCRIALLKVDAVVLEFESPNRHYPQHLYLYLERIGLSLFLSSHHPVNQAGA